MTSCRMRRALILILTSASLVIVSPAAAGPVSAAAGPSRSTALAYAKRTFIVVAGVGNVPFKLGAQKSVTANDGSTITAISITNDYGGTADSTHAALMLFRGGSFLGWASSRAGMFLTLEPSSGHAIRVSYPIWKATDLLPIWQQGGLLRLEWLSNRRERPAAADLRQTGNPPSSQFGLNPTCTGCPHNVQVIRAAHPRAQGFVLFTRS